MAAGLGFKTFVTGDVLTAGDTNGYLMQGVLVFASAAARDSAITSPQEGQFAYLKDTNVTTYYTGSAWTNLVPASSSGLTLITNQTLSAVSSVSINDCFSATYRSYKIVLNANFSSGGQAINLRFRTGGTDNSNSSYNSILFYSLFNGTGNSYQGGVVSGNTSTLGYSATASTRTGLAFEVFEPFATEYTNFFMENNTNTLTERGGGFFANTTSFDGFTLTPGGGTMTGSLQVYGYSL
jgi:hypothetical protein